VDKEKILVVDDEEAIREVISTLLEAQGYRCAVCSNGRMALDTFQNDTFDLVLSDIVMPEMDGLKLLSELRLADPDVPVIMVTAMHDISIALEAIRAGAYDYILKPFEKDQLYRRGNCQPNWNLRRSHPQFCEEPPLGLYRAGRGSGRQAGGPVAVYPVRLDGAGDVVPALHTLNIRRASIQERLFPLLRKEPFAFATAAEGSCGAVSSGVCSTGGKPAPPSGI